MTIILEDQFHAEWNGEFKTWTDAFAELLRLSETPWDQPPNKCPCQSWQTCHRQYELIQYETETTPWKEIKRLGGLEISSNGIEWYAELINKKLPNSYV